ncbi:MAG TPA: hypothetical protein PLA50_03425 [Bacteroidia bacterium]|nr:hypothetical protein [Bacteroidia bacterium]
MDEINDLPPIINIVGEWKSVADSMPDDDITCLVWSTHYNGSTSAYHDSAVLESRSGKRVASGWIGKGGCVIPGVTHYCDDILPPGPTAVQLLADNECCLCDGYGEIDGDDCAQCLGSGIVSPRPAPLVLKTEN